MASSTSVLIAKCRRRDAPAHLQFISLLGAFARAFQNLMLFWTASVEVFISIQDQLRPPEFLSGNAALHPRRVGCDRHGEL